MIGRMDRRRLARMLASVHIKPPAGGPGANLVGVFTYFFVINSINTTLNYLYHYSAFSLLHRFKFFESIKNKFHIC